MSYIFTSSSFPKVRQEGFHTQQQQQSGPQPSLAHPQPPNASQNAQQNISAPNAFDPNAIYTTGALFAEAYRATTADPFARRYEQQQQQSQQSHQQSQQQQPQPATSLDIHDELSFLNPPNSGASDSFQQQQQQQRPHDIFGVNQPHYPSLSLPHSRPLYSRDDYSSTTPASLHNSYGRPDYFPNGQHSTTASNHPNELTPQQQQQQQQQQFGLATVPMPSSLDSFNPGGEQSPAIGVTRSRSRSRSKVSASRSRVSKRPSLPAPPHPHEEDGEDEEETSPPRSSSRAQSSTRPSAIVIPGHAAHPGAAQQQQQQQHPHALSRQHSHSHHQQQHSFSSYHTAGGTASPATWGFPGHPGAGGAGGQDQYGVDGASGHQIFGQSYGSQLGPGQSPTTHSGSPPPSAHPDAATKLALANEKRRKRRESHNAVERRRRDNINEKIQELALLLPEEWLEGPASPTGGTASGKGPSIAGLLSGTVSGSALSAAAGANAGLLDEDSKEVKANKGVILRNSVEYIKNLVQLVQVQRTRNQQLESELAQYRNRFGNVMGGSGGAGNIAMNGVGPLSINGGNGMSPSGMQSSGHTDDEANAMAGYVLADALNSPEGFDMKSMFGASGSIGPLDTLAHGGHGGHGHTLSSGAMGMEGVETSSLGAAGMGMMGMTHAHHNNNNGNGNGHANANGQNVLSSGAAGVSAMLMDTQSPSTGSGEGDEVEDEDMPRGRRTTRFPAGVGKVEDEMGAL